MLCPFCHTQVRSESRVGTKIDSCPECGAIWMRSAPASGGVERIQWRVVGGATTARARVAGRASRREPIPDDGSSAERPWLLGSGVGFG